MLDAQGQVAVNKVLPSDYPLIGAMLYISTIVPLVVTAALLARLWFSARDYLSRFREKRYVQEHTSTVLNRAFTITKEEVEDEEWEHDKEKVEAMRARTSFFFLFDDWLGLAGEQFHHPALGMKCGICLTDLDHFEQILLALFGSTRTPHLSRSPLSFYRLGLPTWHQSLSTTST